MNERIDTETTSELHLDVPLNGYSVSLSLTYDKQERAYTFEAVYMLGYDTDRPDAMSSRTIYMFRRSKTPPDIEGTLLSMSEPNSEVTLSITDSVQQDLIRKWLSANLNASAR